MHRTWFATRTDWAITRTSWSYCWHPRHGKQAIYLVSRLFRVESNHRATRPDLLIYSRELCQIRLHQEACSLCSRRWRHRKQSRLVLPASLWWIETWPDRYIPVSCCCHWLGLELQPSTKHPSSLRAPELSRKWKFNSYSWKHQVNHSLQWAWLCFRPSARRECAHFTHRTKSWLTSEDWIGRRRRSCRNLRSAWPQGRKKPELYMLTRFLRLETAA